MSLSEDDERRLGALKKWMPGIVTTVGESNVAHPVNREAVAALSSILHCARNFIPPEFRCPSECDPKGAMLAAQCGDWRREPPCAPSLDEKVSVYIDTLRTNPSNDPTSFLCATATPDERWQLKTQFMNNINDLEEGSRRRHFCGAWRSHLDE